MDPTSQIYLFLSHDLFLGLCFFVFHVSRMEHFTSKSGEISVEVVKLMHTNAFCFFFLFLTGKSRGGLCPG